MTKLSPFTLSLIGSSPPSLPHLPTLRELREKCGTDPVPIPASQQLQEPSRLKESQRAKIPGYAFESPPGAYGQRSGIGSGWGRGVVSTKVKTKTKSNTNTDIQSGIPGEGRCGKGMMRGSNPYAQVIDEKSEYHYHRIGVTRYMRIGSSGL